MVKIDAELPKLSPKKLGIRGMYIGIRKCRT